MFQSDLKNDIGEIAKTFFHKRGIKPPAEWDNHKMCMKLYDIRCRRFDLCIPYAIVMSDVLMQKLSDYSWKTNVLNTKWGESPKVFYDSKNMPMQRLNPLEDFLIRLKTGKQVTAYLGRDVNKISVEKSDFQLKNWGIYHAHLDMDIAKNRYTGGKNANLLFFQVMGRMVHLIDIKRHPSGSEWFDPDLIETVYRNWPWLLMDMRDFEAIENIPPSKIHELSKHVVICYSLKNGLTVCPSTLGVTTSGDSFAAVRSADDLFRKLNRCEDWLRENETDIRREYKTKKGVELPDMVTFRLKISKEHNFYLQALEIEDLMIKMFSVTDVFYE